MKLGILCSSVICTLVASFALIALFCDFFNFFICLPIAAFHKIWPGFLTCCFSAFFDL
ncbi:uncharacterized protein LACBIDRAFT_303239 [Laccaria bicolor S238N-H82]|uniref:Predicted protein n=1 Tax=Laccaria bicolor (strain S238N-H82 / ATCC MYA-4686) TaxID=486041 RepID=B0DJ68_LACBS|nr:uncharacterized protein LACBIDRAFT_303239 [Laccaria bicolor S238N-H82]EDR05354.1 predicted protein [Laccaria bicolor S238N-H82]|eukprot:XP_001883912.1 predicted protein [Laccaria bicolor S238N-H82]